LRSHNLSESEDINSGGSILTVQPRNTRQKEAIRGALAEAGRPLSPEEILASANKVAERISIATVYRNVKALIEDKWLTSVEIPGESTRYEIAGKGHHHHFHCDECGKVFDLPGCGLQLKPQLPRGYRVTGHEFFLYGVCAACK
jgi:Fur family ferric uptake transcriptional regulator